MALPAASAFPPFRLAPHGSAAPGITDTATSPATERRAGFRPAAAEELSVAAGSAGCPEAGSGQREDQPVDAVLENRVIDPARPSERTTPRQGMAIAMAMKAILTGFGLRGPFMTDISDLARQSCLALTALARMPPDAPAGTCYMPLT